MRLPWECAVEEKLNSLMKDSNNVGEFLCFAKPDLVSKLEEKVLELILGDSEMQEEFIRILEREARILVLKETREAAEP
jgi:hypothetical protein